MNISIDQNLCISCGICEEVCPRHIPETKHINQTGRKYTVISDERVELCMACGHCVSLCPKHAIQLNEINEYPQAEKMEIPSGNLLTLMKQRRSIRNYQTKPLPREEINKIIEAARTAPTGNGQDSVGIIVIDNPEKLTYFSEKTYQMYESLEKGLKNPIARFFIKRTAGKQQFNTLQTFLMPGMHWYIRWYREGRSNEILRDAPTLILFHAPKNEPVTAENCLIAASHAILMSETLGIGTCFNDIIPPACQRVKEIKDLLQLPDNHNVYASITLGYPKYKFKQIPPRNVSEVRYL